MISADHRSRRDRMMAMMEGGAAIFRNPSSGPIDSDFYYMTGFDEPDSACLLLPEHDEHRFVMFVRPKDRNAEIWTGIRVGVEGAKELLGADAVYPIGEFDSQIERYLDRVDKLYYRFSRDEKFNDKIIALIKRYQERDSGPKMLADSGEIVHEMRIKKEPVEIELIRKAIEITAEAYDLVMKSARPGMYEYELEAIFLATYRRHGATGPAYPPIIGSGPNALILHYETNNRQIRQGDLILMDTAAEYRYYDSDITRTIPADGVFTPEQRLIYDIALEAQKRVIDVTKPGYCLDDYNRAAFLAITEGLIDAGILSGTVDEVMESKGYHRFYMHNPGHWLGLDTHDVGKRRIGGKSRVFEPGMILTPETGVYIAADSEGVDPRFWNIGIRIEDDVLITEDGNEVLSSQIPKEPTEIEAIMRRT